MTERCGSRNIRAMNESNHPAEIVPPGKVVIDVIGLMPTVDGLKPEFPNLNRSTVWRWSQPRCDGGTDGIVPSRYHLPLMRLAKQLGRNLTAEDLVFGRGAMTQ